MKWIIGVVLAVIAIGAGVAVFMVPPLMEELRAAREEARQAALLGEGGIDASAAGEMGGAGAEGAVVVDDEALARLREELARATPVEGKSDEQRLADAWEWVRANRDPNRPYNEFEAKMLALFDGIFEGEERSALWLINTSAIEVEMIRALDADGDGMVSDEEMAMFAKENMSLMLGADHPYLKEHMDTNGDGEVSQEEQMEFAMNMGNMMGMLKGAVERAQMDRWDTNLDGVLSDGERAEGLKAAESRFEDMFADALEVPNLEGMDPEQAEQVREQMEQMREQLDQMRESQRDMFMNFAVAEDFMEAMRLENWDQSEMASYFMEGMPESPSMEDFDTDGERGHSPEEMAAFQDAMAKFQTDLQDWQQMQMARMYKAQFDHALSQGDLNGDGRMTDDEWEARIAKLEEERDRRLFAQSYDLDGDGRVGTQELGRYLDWYNAGSLRADSNYDGAVDARDLERMMQLYQNQ